MADLIEKVEEYFNFVSSVSGKFIYFDEALPPVQEFVPVANPIASAQAGRTQSDKIISPIVDNKIQAKPLAPIIAQMQATPATRETDASSTKAAILQIEPQTNRAYIGGNVDANWKESSNLDELYGKIHNCLQCSLGPTRNKFVFGSGSPTADIMIIGEAPGAEEDAQGLPFIGRAGQLLTKILEAINFTREEVFICNIIKCRPPANRRPTTFEVDTCEPYLKKQIEIIKPKFILALGLTAVDTLFKSNHKMGDIRGKIFNYNGIDTLITYHPAALLRNPGWKKLAWEDVKLLRKLYDEYLESDIK